MIRYLLEHNLVENWHVRVGDMDLAFAQSKVSGNGQASAFQMDANDVAQRKSEIAGANLVISMLPAFMHPEVAKDCLTLGKHLITPSYVSDEMLAFDEEARSKGLLFLNEMGVDPGIDHMSAMQIIHDLQSKGAELQSFESFTGGLIAPESDNNPWNYKITWNPRNVVLAGYGGTARFQQDGGLKFIPYQRLFERVTSIEVEPVGGFDGYANRDSLKYKKIYGLESIPTLYRGTLRRAGFCKAWNALVQLGLTDDSFEIEHAETLTWRSLTASFVEMESGVSLEDQVGKYLGLGATEMEKLKWLGIFDEEALGMSKGSPAVALQHLIEKKWKLEDGDKDMIVMWHRFRYTLDGRSEEIQSSLVTEGEDPTYTAMSKTVGLPIAIAAKMILNGQMKQIGVHLPIIPEIYEPVLEELKKYDIHFVEKKIAL
jgi:saccharopine dehydrogenase-like NADP-dependent oxidoreductase